MSQFFASGGQSTGVSASASVFPMSLQGWFPLGLTDLISLLSKGLSRVFSNTTHCSKASILWGPAFFMVWQPFPNTPTLPTATPPSGSDSDIVNKPVLPSSGKGRQGRSVYQTKDLPPAGDLGPAPSPAPGEWTGELVRAARATKVVRIGQEKGLGD